LTNIIIKITQHDINTRLTANRRGQRSDLYTLVFPLTSISDCQLFFHKHTIAKVQKNYIGHGGKNTTITKWRHWWHYWVKMKKNQNTKHKTKV